MTTTIELLQGERSKQAEPVIAYIVEGFEGNTVIAKHLSFEPQQAKDTASVFSQHYPTVSTRALYASSQPAQVNQQQLLDVDWLSKVIRAADGNNTLGAGALAEVICAAIAASIINKRTH